MVQNSNLVLFREVWSNAVLLKSEVPLAFESYCWGVLCGANLWFGGFPYPVNPGRPEWSKVQIRGKRLVATAQATCVSAGE